MKSTTEKGMRFRAMVVTVVVFASGAAQAATISSAPLRIADSNNYSCAAVNVSTKDVAVEVNVSITGGAIGSGASEACSPLSPTSVCVAENQAGSANFRYCTITTSNKRAIRGTFCNTSTGICVPVE
jgi:hypothetical protein